MVWKHCCLHNRTTFKLMDKVVNHIVRRHHHCGRNLVSKMFHPGGARKLPESQEHKLCKSHKLFIYRDIIYPIHPGGYCLLPLGQRAFDKLVKIIEQEMSSIGAQKMSMVTQHPIHLWKESGRWDAVGEELYKFYDRHKKYYCLGPTHEEVITTILASGTMPVSHKRLPVKLYQISRKFRDEMAPKHGLLRGREFEMKDLYTFDASEEDAVKTYESVCEAYGNIFDRLEVPYIKAQASAGNIGGSMSHEFLLEADIGQDKVMTCDKCGYSANVEIDAAEQRKKTCPESPCAVQKKTCIEVGHTFFLGKTYTEAFDCHYRTSKDTDELLEMGCYGIGVSRLLQACIEVLSTSESIRWPEVIAPYKICIIPVENRPIFSDVACALSDELNEIPTLSGDIIVDDQKKNVSSRLKQNQAVGYPYIITVKDKAIQDTPMFEVIDVYKKESMFLNKEQLIDFARTLKSI